MAVSVFDHPLTASLFAGQASARFFTPQAELAAIIRFEAALLDAELETGFVDDGVARRIKAVLADFAVDEPALAMAMASDGVLLPGLLEQIRNRLEPQDRRFLHWGATSQDAMDSGLMLRLGELTDWLLAAMVELATQLDGLSHRFGSAPLMAITRMQPALAISVEDRISAWRDPLLRNTAELTRLRADSLVLQFGGPVGTLDAFGERGPLVRAALARILGLADVPAWHSQRDRLAGYGSSLATLSASLGKMGLDIAMMAREGDSIRLSGSGRSSAMAHKANPVTAEIMVALGRFAAGQSGILAQSQLAEMERSGAAWSLEWMVLPQLAACACASVSRARDLVASITSIGTSG